MNAAQKMTKQSGIPWKAILKSPLLHGLLGGVGNTVAYNSEETPLLDSESWTLPFVKQKAIDAGIGILAGILGGQGALKLTRGDIKGGAAGLVGAIGASGSTAAKNLALSANDTVTEINRSNAVRQALTRNSTQDAGESGISTGQMVGGGLGLAAMLAGGLYLHDYLSKQRDEENAERTKTSPKAVAKVKIPGADGRPESATELEIPVDAPGISEALKTRLSTAAKRRLNRSAKYGQKKKDPVTGKTISYSDYVSMYGTEEEKKEKADEILNAMNIKSAAAVPPVGPPPPLAPIPGTQLVTPERSTVSTAVPRSRKSATAIAASGIAAADAIHNLLLQNNAGRQASPGGNTSNARPA